MSTITTQYQGDMLFETQLGTHTVQIDVPAGMGGSDRAPTPPEYFVASLGACVAALVANYCNQAGLDATGLSVDVSFEKASNPSHLTNMHVTVNLPYADCSKREAALRKVAEHCPVHETMTLLEQVNFEIRDRSQLPEPTT